MSVPRDVGQLPVCYNRPAPKPHDYIDLEASPLYPFGYGLSYTTFEYSNLRIEPRSSQSSTLNPVFSISLDVTNTGSFDGEEVVQLYLRDDVASIVQPLMQLRDFQRLFVPKGETRTVTMTLTADDFAIVDYQLRHVIEPGTFTVMVGRSSADILLKGTITITQ